jgi:hypothetical protein
VANILAAYLLKSGEYAVVGLSRGRRSLQSADTNVVVARAAFTWSCITRFIVLREADLPFAGRRGHTVHCAEARLQAVLRMRIAC